MHTTRRVLDPILVPENKATIRYTISLCSVCLRDKGKRTPLSSTTHEPTIKYSDILIKNDLEPGECISTD